MIVLRYQILQKDVGFEVLPLGSHKKQLPLPVSIKQDNRILFSCHVEGTLVHVAALVRMQQLKV